MPNRRPAQMPVEFFPPEVVTEGGATDDVTGRLYPQEAVFIALYGLGNDTEETEPRAFYKLARGRLLFEPVATAFLGRNVELDVGLRFEASNTDTLPDEPNFVSQARPYGSGSFMQAGAQASVRLDTRGPKKENSVLFAGINRKNAQSLICLMNKNARRARPIRKRNVCRAERPKKVNNVTVALINRRNVLNWIFSINKDAPMNAQRILKNNA